MTTKRKRTRKPKRLLAPDEMAILRMELDKVRDRLAALEKSCGVGHPYPAMRAAVDSVAEHMAEVAKPTEVQPKVGDTVGDPQHPKFWMLIEKLEDGRPSGSGEDASGTLYQSWCTYSTNLFLLPPRPTPEQCDGRPILGWVDGPEYRQLYADCQSGHPTCCSVFDHPRYGRRRWLLGEKPSQAQGPEPKVGEWWQWGEEMPLQVMGDDMNSSWRMSDGLSRTPTELASWHRVPDRPKAEKGWKIVGCRVPLWNQRAWLGDVWFTLLGPCSGRHWIAEKIVEEKPKTSYRVVRTERRKPCN